MARKLYKPVLIDSVKAAANLTEHTFVKFDGNTCTAGEKAYGVVDVSTEKDQFAPVGLLGIFLVVSGGEISVGDAITSDANGKAVTVATNNAINGYALDAATAAGQDIRILRGI